MTPKELSQALQVRRLRERKAEKALRKAQAVVVQARAARDGAVGKLAAFDHDLESRVAAFFDRGSLGIDPGRIEGMKTFHADQMLLRTGFVDAIGQAEQIVASAEQFLAQTRSSWQRANNAAENLQDFSQDENRRHQRELSRRAEMDVDELAVGQTARRKQE